MRSTSRLPKGDEKVAAVRGMFDRIAPRYELVNRVITFGLDARWRKAALADLALPKGSVVLDLACGTGDLCRLAAQCELQPIGIDMSLGMLTEAHTNAPLVQADALELPVRSASVDGALSGFALRNFVDLPRFFAELARVVRPGGRIALLDACRPTNRILATGHGIYFGHVVPFVGGLLSDPSAYRYLPESLAYLPPVPQLIESLAGAGFAGVRRRTFAAGATHLLTATRS